MQNYLTLCQSEHYYNPEGRKQEIYRAESQYTVGAAKTGSAEQIIRKLRAAKKISDEVIVSAQLAVVRLDDDFKHKIDESARSDSSNPDKFLARNRRYIKELRDSLSFSDCEFITPVYVIKRSYKSSSDQPVFHDDKLLALRDEIVVSFSSNVTPRDLESFINEYDLEFLKRQEWHTYNFRISRPDDDKTLQVANAIYEIARGEVYHKNTEAYAANAIKKIVFSHPIFTGLARIAQL
jgi:hypothetical protein